MASSLGPGHGGSPSAVVTPPAPPASAAAGSLSKLTQTSPPLHFALVEEGVYRSAYPTTANARYLQGLRLRLVVTLSLEVVPMQVRRMMEGHGAQVVALGHVAWAARNNFDPALIARTLELILDADNHPMMIMCATGELQTCAVVGALRKLQGWCYASIDTELQHFTSASVRSHHIAIFEAIERFDHRFFFACAVEPRIAAQRHAVDAAERNRRQQQQQQADEISDAAHAAAGSSSATLRPTDAAGHGATRAGGETPDVATPQLPSSTAVSKQVSPSGGRPPASGHDDLVDEALVRLAGAPAPTSTTRQFTGDLDIHAAGLAAPLPLWYLQGLQHMINTSADGAAAGNASILSPPPAHTTSGPGQTTSSAGGNSRADVVAAIRQAAAAAAAATAAAASEREPSAATSPSAQQQSTAGRLGGQKQAVAARGLVPLISDRNGYSKAESLVDSDDD